MITGAGSTIAGGTGIKRAAVRPVAGHVSHGPRAGACEFLPNPDDARLFRSLGLIRARNRVVLINGSGVDLTTFSPVPLPTGPTTFLTMARLIGDKGVDEYAEAARQVRQDHPNARFQLLGLLDSNPSAISPGELERSRRAGAIEYLGATTAVRPHLARGCAAFPRTGTACLARSSRRWPWRVVLTTDVAGRRQTVKQGRYGFLVAARDVGALAAGMKRILAEPDELARMGQQSRRVAEERFDVQDVNRTILAAIGID